VIEALELPGQGFVLAVQWHPEESLDDLRLFLGDRRGRHRHTRARWGHAPLAAVRLEVPPTPLAGESGAE